jgi:hypothetical protein
MLSLRWHQRLAHGKYRIDKKIDLSLVGWLDFTTLIRAAMRTGMVRTHHLSALGAFTHAGGNNAVMRPAHVAP